MLLKALVEYLQKYTRRQHVRIFGIHVSENETSEGVVNLKTRTKIPTLKKVDGTKARDAKDKAQALNVFFRSVYQQECNIIPPVTKNYNGTPPPPPFVL